MDDVWNIQKIHQQVGQGIFNSTESILEDVA